MAKRPQRRRLSASQGKPVEPEEPPPPSPSSTKEGKEKEGEATKRSSDELKYILREIELLKGLDHPNVIHLYDYFVSAWLTMSHFPDSPVSLLWGHSTLARALRSPRPPALLSPRRPRDDRVHCPRVCCGRGPEDCPREAPELPRGGRLHGVPVAAESPRVPALAGDRPPRPQGERTRPGAKQTEETFHVPGATPEEPPCCYRPSLNVRPPLPSCPLKLPALCRSGYSTQPSVRRPAVPGLTPLPRRTPLNSSRISFWVTRTTSPRSKSWTLGSRNSSTSGEKAREGGTPSLKRPGRRRP